MVDELGEKIWPGFSTVPFPVLLVTEEVEFLIDWDGQAPRGFTRFDDGRLGSVLYRDRVFPPTLSAAFPAFGPPSVVVIGTMETTGRTAAEWALTLLHEHFHQTQNAGEGYYADVEGLDLAGGDQSGMWMLEYPFPYADHEIGELFGDLVTALNQTLEDNADAESPWAALRRLIGALDPADARYLSFQLWQEGVSRFVELAAADALAAGFDPSPDFLALGEFDGWGQEAAAQRERVTTGLEGAVLAEKGRVAFYPAGAALAMLLERRDPAWKSRYETPRFALDRYGRDVP